MSELSNVTREGKKDVNSENTNTVKTQTQIYLKQSENRPDVIRH